jgi:hypothetical protein
VLSNRYKLVLCLLLLLIAGPSALLLHEKWELEAFARNVGGFQRDHCRVLASSLFSDTGDYSGDVRLNYVVAIAGDRQNILKCAKEIRARIPAAYSMSYSEPARFSELNRRGYEQSEFASVLHVSYLKPVGWTDISHWND